MKAIAGLVLGVCALLSLAYAGDKKSWAWEYRPVKASYAIYSGELGDEAAPTQNERKLSLEITGQAAKEIFDSMSPDIKPSCSGEKGDRDRRKGKLYCTYHQGDGYRCFIGVDLRTGQSIAGGTC
ncbi:hypothetical protein [Massilia sp. YIM B04103]|uniref:hypothetical protein n=1 Tax=Massilia sp. YIM B04103 TaxID=2963106 RepID=UPI00210B81EB|nr:hypothetical protein [Massilia sp. YIM B04103]